MTNAVDQLLIESFAERPPIIPGFLNDESCVFGLAAVVDEPFDNFIGYVSVELPSLK